MDSGVDAAGKKRLEERIASLEAIVAERDATIAGLQGAVRALTARVEEFAELLARNSKNSHLPPSSDGPTSGAGEQSSEKKEPKSGKKRGGQPGHRGSHRALLSVELVDSFIEHYPSCCEGCADDLSPVFDPGALRHQQLDLRNHCPHLTEHRQHEIACPTCGTRTRAAYDSSIPRFAFGPHLTAVVCLLTGVYHLSRRKAQTLLLELFGISISLGAISAMEGRTRAALKSGYEEARREVQQAGVKHADATSWARYGKLMSLWTIATTMATFYEIFPDGCRHTIEPMFGACLGFLVSDRASVFGFWDMVWRQICWAHLLRKFISFSQRDGPAGKIGQRLLELTALVFEYWHGYKDGKLSRKELKFWLRPVREDFERELTRAALAGIERLSGSCADILAHREALWNFVEHEGVEPTNNHAERELRAFVLWRRRSFGTQSERGDRFAERIMTIVHTARKQGTNVLQYLVASITAHLGGTLAPRLIDAGAAA